ncbi:MAG TPA: hypothetical protein V6C88_00165 [Chroococcidiopsis sp.]
MTIAICPGIHSASDTQQAIKALKAAGLEDEQWWIFPADRHPSYSAPHLFHFWQQQSSQAVQPNSPLTVISFSAGVVGAIGAAIAWQAWGGSVQSFIALDGWGVPLIGTFPIYRLSHDYFTHQSSARLGGGPDSFYADPDIAHLDLWRSPDTAQGWHIQTHSDSTWGPPTSRRVERRRTTAAQFIVTVAHAPAALGRER